MSRATIDDTETIEKFRQAMVAQGIVVTEMIKADGELHRYHAEGDKRGRRNVWAILHLDGKKPAGAFGCFRRYGSNTKFTWSGETRDISPEERRAWAKKMAAQKAEREAEERERRKAAAEHAQFMWDQAQECTEHPYLTRKGVKSYGLRVGPWEKIDRVNGKLVMVSKQALLIPIRDAKKNIHSLQAIFVGKICGGRDKDFVKDGAKAGLFYSIGKPQTVDVGGEQRQVIMIGEGYATMASAHECTGHAAIVAFDAGNLMAVGRVLRQRFADAVLLFLADNDQWTRGPIENVGLTKAREAATAVGGLVAVPPFAADAPGKPTDFNDLQALYGAGVVRDIIEAALEDGERPASIVVVPTEDEALDVAYALECIESLERVLAAHGGASRPMPYTLVLAADNDLARTAKTARIAYPEAPLHVLATHAQQVDAFRVAADYGATFEMPPDNKEWAGWGQHFLGLMLRWIDAAADLDPATRDLTSEVLEQAASAQGVATLQDDYAPDEILLEEGELPRIIDLAERALLARAPNLYTRGSRIVRPIKVPTTVTGGNVAAITQIKPLPRHGLMEELTRVAVWRKNDRRRREEDVQVRVNCPLEIADTLLARDQWSLRPLTAIIHGPTLRADGSVLEAKGYDVATGLLLQPNAAFEPVPQNPSRDEALDALARLDELVCKFPFVTKADRSVWLAALLTAAIRRSLPTAPLFAFSAPTAGTGKSYLADMIAIIVTGEAAPALSQGRTEEENEKRLTGVLLSGHTIINIDNCTLAIDGDFLCSVLTQPIVEVRKMGGHEVRRIPGSATMLATGNSLVIAGDMTRRALVCSLDAGVERPELRVFDFNPLEKAKHGRARYLVDALTILRAFHVAGRPRQVDEPFGSFETWSDWVRSALLWLGLDDSNIVMERTRKSDPKLLSLREILHGLYRIFGKRQLRAREIISSATALMPFAKSVGPGAEDYEHPDLREALLAVAGEGGAINSKRLGKWLAANRGRPVDGLRLMEVGDDRNGIKLWAVVADGPPV